MTSGVTREGFFSTIMRPAGNRTDAEGQHKNSAGLLAVKADLWVSQNPAGFLAHFFPERFRTDDLHFGGEMENPS